MTGPPPLPTSPARSAVQPHRAPKLIILAAIAFVFAPCGFVAVVLARRDLRAMAAGTMDRAGEKQTRFARTLAVVASLVWAIKWAIAIGLGIVIYLNWDRVSRLLP
jgi:hypothetical protein